MIRWQLMIVSTRFKIRSFCVIKKLNKTKNNILHTLYIISLNIFSEDKNIIFFIFWISILFIIIIIIWYDVVYLNNLHDLNYIIILYSSSDQIITIYLTMYDKSAVVWIKQMWHMIWHIGLIKCTYAL